MVDVSTNRQMERTLWKCFRCGSEDHIIAKFPRQVCFNEKGNRASNNGEKNSDYEIYASMVRISRNDEWKIHGDTEN